jgi:hypothetical protein
MQSGVEAVDAILRLALLGSHSVAGLELSGMSPQHGVEVGGLRDAAEQR